MWDPKRQDWEAKYLREQRSAGYMESVARQIDSFGIDAHRRDVLDIGCGPGVYLRHMQRQGANRVVGFDLSPYYLSRLGGSWAPGADAVCGSAEALPFCGESFDLALLLNTLCHLRGDRSLAEAERILRPGGLLWVSHNLPGYYWWKLRRRKGRDWKTYMMEALSSVKRLVESVIPFAGRVPSMPRWRFLRMLRPFEILKEEVISADGVRCQVLVLARKPDDAPDR